MTPIYLTLEDGTIFEGKSFGAKQEIIGEVVFTTAMTGYMETLSDPSYHGQFVVATFPLIGNYGTIKTDLESYKIHPSAYIVKHLSDTPSNFRNEGQLGVFLCEQNVVGVCDIDTRQLTKLLREKGQMNAKITFNKPTPNDIFEIKRYKIKNSILEVTKKDPIFDFPIGKGINTVVMIDFGAKRSITTALANLDCRVVTLASSVTLDDILAIKPAGILLSNGPGNPNDEANKDIIELVKKLFETKIPMFGIGLGHQLMALAKGYRTEKMKVGHRGANVPVKYLPTGRVYITNQNHGYMVMSKNSSYVNVNDGSCEGLEYEGGSFSVQFSPETITGHHNTYFLFEKFASEVKKHAIKA